jgi:hypothetical protein
MKINSENFKNANFNELLNYTITIVAASNRRKTNKEFLGKPNCSGANINKYLVNGMSLVEYQAMIIDNFNSSDPQFSLTKHLKYDIEHGHIELVK